MRLFAVRILMVIAIIVMGVLVQGCLPEAVEKLSRTESTPYSCGVKVPDRHLPQVVMGRDYWSLMFAFHLTDPSYVEGGHGLPSWMNVPELVSRPMFRDCALVYRGDVGAPDPDKGKATYWTLQENFASNGRWDQVERASKSDKPMFLNPRSKRGASTFVGDIDLDMSDYFGWKARHPNFVVFRAASEWENDVQLAYWMTNVHKKRWRYSQKSLDELAKFLSPWPQDREGRVSLQKKAFDRKIALHYGDQEHCSAMRAAIAVDHLAAAWGAGVLELETTNTSTPPQEYRWNIQPMFTRGAARQFGRPWTWYVAQFFNGYRKDGAWMNDSVAGYLWPGRDKKTHPERGISPSLNRRAYFMAYLSGANFVEQEGWVSSFLEKDPETGKARLSVRGKNFSDYHDFTVAHPDRGTPYTPVAVLVPFGQGYPAYGGRSWCSFAYTPGDQTVDAVFFTIDPGRDREADLRAGRETSLHNTKYAMMYDVICPDAPQAPEELLAVLKSYRAVILTGDYPDRTFEKTLRGYESSGGRVIRIDPLSLPPIGDGDEKRYVADIQKGLRKFPSVAGILDGLQNDYFPVSVSGDCLYGLNVRKDGSAWLWCFNNNGVTKFADQFESVDREAASKVTVLLKKLKAGSVRELMSGKTLELNDGAFSFVIPAGDLAIFEMGR